MAGGGAGGIAQGASSSENGSSFWSFMLPVLGAIATGIGVVGFVILFGGFVLWTRFEAAGLPADQAVAEVPRSDLIATGAGFLVPAVLASLAAVLIALTLWDLLVGAPRRRRERQAASVHERAVRDLTMLQRRAVRLRQQAAAAERASSERNAAVEQLAAALGTVEAAQRPAIVGRLDAAEGERDQQQQTYAQLQQEISDLEDNRIPEAEDTVTEKAEDLKAAGEVGWRDKWKAMVAVGAPMLVAEVWIIAAGLRGLSLGAVVVLALLTVGTVSVAIVIVSNTERFGWYALMVFFGVGILIAASTYVRTHATTKMSPVAAIVGSEPVVGYFVSETPDAVYVARPTLVPGRDPVIDHAGITLERLPKESVSHLTVGPLTAELIALRRSLALAWTLCEHPAVAAAAQSGGARSGGDPSGGGASASKHLCTDAAIAALEAERRQDGA